MLNKWHTILIILVVVFLVSGLRGEYKKWEYKVVPLETEEILNQMGNYGWELVAVYSQGETAEALYTPAYELHKLKSRDERSISGLWNFSDWSEKRPSSLGTPIGYFKRPG